MWIHVVELDFVQEGKVLLEDVGGVDKDPVGRRLEVGAGELVSQCDLFHLSKVGHHKHE